MLRKYTPVAASLFTLALLASPPALAVEKKPKTAELAQATTPPPADAVRPAADAAMPPPPTDTAAPAPAESAGPPPDPAKISATSSVVENASNSPDHTTLVKAVKAAGLADALSAPGPVTLFAPSNAGFDRLPPGTVDALLKPENQGSLSNILNNHVVAGKVTAADLAKKIKAGKGKASLTTLSGGTLTAIEEGGAIKITDGNGNASQVTQADIMGSNGVIHAINGILIPSAKKAEAPAR